MIHGILIDQNFLWLPWNILHNPSSTMNSHSKEASSDNQSPSVSQGDEPSTTCSSSDATNGVYVNMPELVAVDPSPSVVRGRRDHLSPARSAHAASSASPRR